MVGRAFLLAGETFDGDLTTKLTTTSAKWDLRGYSMAQQWEYCSLYLLAESAVVDFCQQSGNATQFTATRQEFNVLLARLGLAGWELVGVSPGDVLYFKRLWLPGRPIDEGFA